MRIIAALALFSALRLLAGCVRFNCRFRSLLWFSIAQCVVWTLCLILDFLGLPDAAVWIACFGAFLSLPFFYWISREAGREVKRAREREARSGDRSS